MKHIFMLALVLLAFTAQAQLNSINPVRRYEGEVEYNKTMQNARSWNSTIRTRTSAMPRRTTSKRLEHA